MAYLSPILACDCGYDFVNGMTFATGMVILAVSGVFVLFVICWEFRGTVHFAGHGKRHRENRDASDKSAD